MRGFIQIYTGDGKGKTTAALGLALRAAGAGLKVFIAQLIKGKEYSEHRALEKLGDLITIRQYGRGCFIYGKPGDEDAQSAAAGLREAKDCMVSGTYDLVILDEANVAVHLGLFSIGELLEVMDAKPEHVELVITGRDAHPRVLERADLVTEMHAVKHYYSRGIKARRGIEF